MLDNRIIKVVRFVITFLKLDIISTKLENIITTLKADGWQFGALTNEIKPVIFRMK